MYMLKIRLQRTGRRNNPSYRVVVIESAAAAKKGKPVEVLGVYDTVRKTTTLRNDRIMHWIARGAQTSDTMHNILVTNGVIEGVKWNVLPKKQAPVKEQDGGAGAADEERGTDGEAGIDVEAPKAEEQPETGDTQSDTATDSTGETADEKPVKTDSTDEAADGQPVTPDSDTDTTPSPSSGG